MIWESLYPMTLLNPSTRPRHQLSRRPKYAKAIGIIALETVDLEIELALLFSSLLGLPPYVGETIYLTPRTDQARIEILRNTASIIFAVSGKPHSPPAKQKRKYKDRIFKLLEDAQNCIQHRHRAVH